MRVRSLLQHRRYLILLVLVAVGLLVHSALWQRPIDELIGEDIYYIWLEGKRIVAGENPYARVLAGNIRENNKYATYFPVFYLFAAAYQKLGFPTFEQFIAFWRPVSLAFQLGIVWVAIEYFRSRRLLLLGFVTAMVILLGRWNLYVARAQTIEFAAIFFLIVSLVWLQEKPRLSLLAYSLSLGIKQIAIILLPLYIIYLWRKRGAIPVGPLSGICIIASIPVLSSLPFLIWNFEGFVRSILFSATRNSASHLPIVSLDAILSQQFPIFVGLVAKLPMLFLLACLYASALQARVGIFLQSAVAMAIFIHFHSVLFIQYLPWLLCLLPFAAVESLPQDAKAKSS